MDNLLKEAYRHEEEMIALRRDLHRNPELSLNESRTAAKVAEHLRTAGLYVTVGVGGHGVVAEIAGESVSEAGRPARVIALRADIDALPILEETGLEYASERPGVMHACGHDLHTAVLVGAAKILNARKSLIRGKVRFIFQPAEEILSGASAMIAENVMDEVDEIYGLHNLPSLPAGKVGIKAGVLMAAIDRFEITVKGIGGHGGYPETCVDPIIAASAVTMGLQIAVSRETPATVGVVVSIGTVHAGTANNVIPDEVHMTGTVRNLDVAWRETMPERIERIVKNICCAYRCTAQVTYIRQVAPVVNSEVCTSVFEEVSDSIIGKENRILPTPMTYGEDFSEYMMYAPGCFFWLGSGARTSNEAAAGLHSSRFNPDESCMVTGAALFAGIVLRRLG